MQLLSYKANSKELSFIDQRFPFSFSNGYSRFIENAGDIFFILKLNDHIAPLIIKKNLFFKTLQFHFKPLSIFGKELSELEEKSFLDTAIEFITKKAIAHRIIHSANFALFNVIPSNTISSPYGSYVINLLNKDEEELLHLMQPRYRTAIRAAQKLNPEIRTGINELSAFWELHKKTMDRTSMYAESYDELKSLQKFCPESILIANCYIENVIQGGVYIMYSSYGSYYLHGASANTTTSDGAIKFLHYSCMCKLKKLHSSLYDFVGARLSNIEGTKLEGIQNFKKRFGSELKQGYLWKKDISPFVCRTYDSLLHLKLSIKGLKVPKDIIDQEKEK